MRPRRITRAIGGRLRWFLTRRARTPRPVRMALALVLATVALVSLASPQDSRAGKPQIGVTTTTGKTLPPPTSSGQTPIKPPARPGSGALSSQGGPPTSLTTAPAKSPEAPGAGDPTTSFPTSPATVAEGQTLYENGCAACHGTLLQGRPAVAPSLIGVGPGPVDFYLSTGRMPLQAPRDEPERTKPSYTPTQIHDMIAFITKFGGGPPAPAVDPAKGTLAQGFQVFDERCAGCHQIVGRGGLTIGGYVPNLQAATPLQIAEAVRMGPFLMPHFDAKQIDQQQLDSLARYVLWTRHPDNAGGWGIYNIGPIPEGMVAWFIALLAIVIVARLIGERVA